MGKRDFVGSGSLRRQRGAALILALLIVSLVAGLATSMAGEHLLNIKYQRNYLDEEQAYFYLLSAETLAQRTLFFDMVGDQNHLDLRGTRGIDRPDNFCEEWTRSKRFDIDGGYVRYSMEDLNGKFNINLIGRVQKAVNQNFPFTIHQSRFVRLLQTFDELEIDEEKAIEIAEAVYDWVDQNSVAEGFGGMEDSEYAVRDLNYRTSNSGMYSISELRLIPAISPALYRRLRKHVSVWPELGRVGQLFSYAVVNLNTATPNYLRSILHHRGLQPVPYEKIIPVLAQQRSSVIFTETHQQQLSGNSKKYYTARCGYESVGTFAAQFPEGVQRNLLVGNSNQFLIRTEVRIGGITRRMESVIHRLKLLGELQIWARSFGPLY